MSGRRCRVLIFDCDEDTLIVLQQVFEDHGFDTTISWDETEARKLIENRAFDLLLVGDHPPELTTETIVRNFNPKRVSCPCFLLQPTQLDSEEVRRLDISGVVSKRDPFRVLEEVKTYWGHPRLIRPQAKTVDPSQEPRANRAANNFMLHGRLA